MGNTPDKDLNLESLTEMLQKNTNSINPQVADQPQTHHLGGLQQLLGEDYHEDVDDDHEQSIKKVLKARKAHKRRKTFKRKQKEETEHREKMTALISNFSREQLNRYEIYRRAVFKKTTIKNVMETMCKEKISQNTVIAMAGVAKVFVGEVVEEALDVMEQFGETGALKPKHLREAVRRLRNADKIPMGHKAKQFFSLN